MFVAFVGICNPCPRIYTPTSVYTGICLIFIKIIPNLLPTKIRPYEPGQFWLPTNIDPRDYYSSAVPDQYHRWFFLLLCLFVRIRCSKDSLSFFSIWSTLGYWHWVFFKWRVWDKISIRFRIQVKYWLSRIVLVDKIHTKSENEELLWPAS